MRVEVFHQKNMYGEHTAQVDYGDVQVSIIAPKKKEVIRILKHVRKIIKPNGVL